jgi:hypothetical protein
MKPVCVVVSPAVVMHPFYKLYLMWNIFEAMGAIQVIKGWYKSVQEYSKRIGFSVNHLQTIAASPA